jgi:hypothetical protein
MTSHTVEPSIRRHKNNGPPPTRQKLQAQQSMRRASLTAGISYLLMVPLSAVGVFMAVQGLTTPGDADSTARNIVASEGLFRLGIVSLFANVALDMVVAWALYRVFSPVNRSISRLAAWFQIVFAGVFMVAIGELPGVLRLLDTDAHPAVFDARQMHSLALERINTFTSIWDAGMVFFGLHLVLVGYLTYRSGFMPRLLGVLVVIAGLGYLSDSIGQILFQSYTTDIGLFTFPGELLLAIWLLVRAGHIAATASERSLSTTPQWRPRQPRQIPTPAEPGPSVSR